MIKIHVFIVMATIALSACATTQPAQTPATATVPSEKGFLVWLDERLPDGEQRHVRMVVTDRFMRMDDGQANADYVLLDRRAHRAYNVVNADQSIRVMGDAKPPAVALPTPPAWTESVEPSNVLMRSDTPNALTAQHYAYSLAGAACYHVVTVDGLLPEVLAAWRDYKKILAQELAQTYDPVIDGTDPCRAAAEILASAELLEHGFPLREWSEYGYSRFVQDYRWDMKFDSKLFELPSNYRRYQFSAGAL